MARGGGWTMSAKEELRLKVMAEFQGGKLSRDDAAILLGVNWRTVTRWAGQLRRHGPRGIRHGNRDRRPHNASALSWREEALGLYRDRYFDFNMSHCYELLVRDHGLKVSLSTFKAWCRKANIGRRKRRRPSKQRIARERMAMRGLMLQMDGSNHAWNGRDQWALVGAIDDASSELPSIQFFPRENTFSCMAVLRRVIEKHGIPCALYVDQARWFGGLKAEEKTQFARACQELGITLIAALSPQAKGRIERVWRTFQDRLIPELRVAGIQSMEDANRYLEESFLPQYWQERCTVKPRSDETRYRPLDKRINLDEIFCLKHERKVAPDHTINFNGVIYKLKPSFVGSISGKHVTIHQYPNGSWRVYFGPLEVDARRHLTRGRRHWYRAS